MDAESRKAIAARSGKLDEDGEEGAEQMTDALGRHADSKADVLLMFKTHEAFCGASDAHSFPFSWHATQQLHHVYSSAYSFCR